MPTEDHASNGHQASARNRTPTGYPEAQRLEISEVIHGHQVADPYRWLEDPADSRTQDWCAQQGELFSEWQARPPGDGAAARLRQRLTALAQEYGSAGDPEEFTWLLAHSPYHHVRRGVCYPAALFTVFGNDARVDPMHARKLVAALQHATSAPAGRRPILLRQERNAGHTARPVSRSVSLWLDQLEFFARQLGPGAGD